MKDNNFKNNKHFARTLGFTHNWALVLVSHSGHVAVQTISSGLLSCWGDNVVTHKHTHFPHYKHTYGLKIRRSLFLSFAMIKKHVLPATDTSG
jgi:hypothetical protein